MLKRAPRVFSSAKNQGPVQSFPNSGWWHEHQTVSTWWSSRVWGSAPGKHVSFALLTVAAFDGTALGALACVRRWGHGLGLYSLVDNDAVGWIFPQF